MRHPVGTNEVNVGVGFIPSASTTVNINKDIKTGLGTFKLTIAKFRNIENYYTISKMIWYLFIIVGENITGLLRYSCIR